MINTRYGMLVVIERLKNSKIKCLCDCGKERILSVGHFNAGYFKSCGCHYLHLRHGKNKSREYNSWSNMLARCHNNKNKRFNDYGGKGIVVCDRWRNSFINFYKDMGSCPDGYQIDRRNNDGNYEPSNCRWVTPKQNMANRKISKKYKINDVIYNSSTDAAIALKVSICTIHAWCKGRTVGEKFYPAKINCYCI